MPTSCGRAEGELRARSGGRADGGAEAQRRAPTPAVAGELRGEVLGPPLTLITRLFAPKRNVARPKEKSDSEKGELGGANREREKDVSRVK